MIKTILQKLRTFLGIQAQKEKMTMNENVEENGEVVIGTLASESFQFLSEKFGGFENIM